MPSGSRLRQTITDFEKSSSEERKRGVTVYRHVDGQRSLSTERLTVTTGGHAEKTHTKTRPWCHNFLQKITRLCCHCHIKCNTQLEFEDRQSWRNQCLTTLKASAQTRFSFRLFERLYNRRQIFLAQVFLVCMVSV